MWFFQSGLFIFSTFLIIIKYESHRLPVPSPGNHPGPGIKPTSAWSVHKQFPNTSTKESSLGLEEIEKDPGSVALG